MSTAELPDECQKHQADYFEGAWRNYTLAELGQWVALLAKRATHRTQQAKRDKDLYDAQNYLDMMQAHIDHLRSH